MEFKTRYSRLSWEKRGEKGGEKGTGSGSLEVKGKSTMKDQLLGFVEANSNDRCERSNTAVRETFSFESCLFLFFFFIF